MGDAPANDLFGHREDAARIPEIAVADVDLLPRGLVQPDRDAAPAAVREVALLDRHDLRTDGPDHRTALLVAAVLEVAAPDSHVGTGGRLVAAAAVDVDRQPQQPVERAVLDQHVVGAVAALVLALVGIVDGVAREVAEEAAANRHALAEGALRALDSEEPALAEIGELAILHRQPIGFDHVNSSRNAGLCQRLARLGTTAESDAANRRVAAAVGKGNHIVGLVARETNHGTLGEPLGRSDDQLFVQDQRPVNHVVASRGGEPNDIVLFRPLHGRGQVLAGRHFDRAEIALHKIIRDRMASGTRPLGHLLIRGSRSDFGLHEFETVGLVRLGQLGPIPAESDAVQPVDGDIEPAQRPVHDRIVLEEHPLGSQRALLVLARAELDVRAVDEEVVADVDILHQTVAVRKRVGHGVHQRQRREESAARQRIEAVVVNPVSGIHHAHASRVALAVADEDIAAHLVAVAVAQGQHALALPEAVVADDVVARLDRHHLHLAVAAVEEVILDDRVRRRVGLVRGAHADGLGAVRSVNRTIAEQIMVDAVAVLQVALLVQNHDEGHAQIELAGQVAMVHAIVPAVEGDIAVGDVAPHGIVAVDDAVRQAAIVRHLLSAAELHHRPFGGASVQKVEALHLDPLARQTQARPAGDDSPLRIGLDADGRLLGAVSDPFQFQIPVGAALDYDAVARSGRLQHSGHLAQRHAILLRPSRKGRQQAEQQDRYSLHSVHRLSLYKFGITSLCRPHGGCSPPPPPRGAAPVSAPPRGAPRPPDDLRKSYCRANRCRRPARPHS